MADASVRPARSDDVAEIARIQLSTWATAYGRFLPPAVLDAATPDRVAEQWGAAVLAPPTARHRVLVATEGEERVGFTAFGPPPEDSGPGGAPATTAEIVALLVEPRWGRRGHGSRLLAAAVDHLRADGFTASTIWLIDRDRASDAFLTSAGWAPDGTARTLDAAGAELREVRLHTALDEQPAGADETATATASTVPLQ